MATHNIEVGPKPDELWHELDSDPLQGEQIEWHSDRALERRTFNIIFPVAGATVNGVQATNGHFPFANMHYVADPTGSGHGYWAFNDTQYSGNTCASGSINSALPIGTPAAPVIKKYKYDQHNRNGAADGRIIIKP